jgi:hypothetical protein
MPADESSPLLSSTTESQTSDETQISQLEPQETMSSSILWKIGAISGATAVGLGAFGAHGLKKSITDPQKLANWSTAAQYQVLTSTSQLSSSETTANILSYVARPLGSPINRKQQPCRWHAFHCGHDNV